MAVLIVSPLKIELSHLIQSAKKSLNCEAVESRVGTQKIWTLGDYIFAVGGHGKTQFALQAQSLLLGLSDIRLVCIAGAGGGLSLDAKALDVVVATEIIEHDYKEKFNPTFGLPRFRVASEVLAQLQSLSFDNFKLHFAPIASGDEDIVDHVRAEELFKKLVLLLSRGKALVALVLLDFIHFHL